MSNVLPRGNTSGWHAIRPELSGLCKRSDRSSLLMFVYLSGTSVPKVHRAL